MVASPVAQPDGTDDSPHSLDPQKRGDHHRPVPLDEIMHGKRKENDFFRSQGQNAHNGSSFLEDPFALLKLCLLWSKVTVF
jgi:hypothetical protein